MRARPLDPNSTMQRMLRRFRASATGRVFTVKDFLDLGSRAAVDLALLRLRRDGVIERVGRGIYQRPRISPVVGSVPPSPVAVARAAVRASGGRIAPTGAAALNALGVSSQVPARAEYLTDVTSRHLSVGGRTVKLRHVGSARIAEAGTPAGTVIEALRHLGPDGVTPAIRRQIARTLTVDDARALQRAARHAPSWAVAEIHSITKLLMDHELPPKGRGARHTQIDTHQSTDSVTGRGRKKGSGSGGRGGHGRIR